MTVKEFFELSKKGYLYSTDTFEIFITASVFVCVWAVNIMKAIESSTNPFVLILSVMITFTLVTNVMKDCKIGVLEMYIDENESDNT